MTVTGRGAGPNNSIHHQYKKYTQYRTDRVAHFETFLFWCQLEKEQQTSFVEDFSLYAEWHNIMVLRSEKHFPDQISTNWSSHK